MTTKETKVLCIGDPHFKVSNIQEIELFIEKCVELVKETKPDLVCVLGDLLHTSVFLKL